MESQRDISKVIRSENGISKYSHASQGGWEVTEWNTVSDFRNLKWQKVHNNWVLYYECVDTTSKRSVI